MFIVCKACDGSGEGVYGHSWTPCPVCNGAGQVVQDQMALPRVTFEQIAVHVRTPIVRPVRSSAPLGLESDIDPTGVFPDPEYERRTSRAA